MSDQQPQASVSPQAAPAISANKWPAALCGVQAVAAVVAAGAAMWEVESILGFCPAIAVLGLLLAFAGVRRLSLNLFLFGLSSPLVTSFLAMLIALFDMGPGQAELPAAVLLSLNAAVAVVWGGLTGWYMLRAPSPRPAPVARKRFQFSLKSMLIVITVLCPLLAVASLLQGDEEVLMFGGYGIAVLCISLGLAGWFAVRARGAGRSEPTVSPPAADDFRLASYGGE